MSRWAVESRVHSSENITCSASPTLVLLITESTYGSPSSRRDKVRGIANNVTMAIDGMPFVVCAVVSIFVPIPLIFEEELRFSCSVCGCFGGCGLLSCMLLFPFPSREVPLTD